jgi:hypothetical protein
MTVTELVDLLKFYFSHNDNQSDSVFADSRWVSTLNLAYKREWIDVTQNVSKKHYLEYQDITWGADEETYVLPDSIQQKTLYAFRDVTDDEVGILFRPGWKDKRTLAWGTDGPSEDKTIRIYYVASPETLVEDGPGPDLIPDAFHEILVWSAVCQLRALSDDGVPGSFEQYLADWRERLYKAMCARPVADVNIIGIASDEALYGANVQLAAVTGGTVDPVTV